ncbi:MAG: radical SAM family heme chaperone HemW [Coriobacteriales bacterium]|jgi:oxygen-independent coproporphyrinogen-3 oxidase|nr:radical SAM family heme chaperone HemW [Coriobacteriales bacterium]
MSFIPPESDPAYQALYIHIPFCARRCNYCDFTTEAVRIDDSRIDTYLDAMLVELAAAKSRDLLGAIKTVYIGGGTPSFLGDQRLGKLVEAITEQIDGIREFTVEANPDSFTQQMARLLAGLGVNRLSIGIQSFDNHELTALGRLHDSKQAELALDAACQVFENVSVDIMCGIPLQTAATFQASLQQAVASGINHVSVYPLSLEAGTALAEAVAAGRLTVATDDEQARLLNQAASYLEAEGFIHYEIASYARPGFNSQHNSAYWTARPYLGLGRGAVGMSQQQSVRYRFDDQGILEQLDLRQQAAEDLMLGLRLLSGVPDGVVAHTQALLPTANDCLAELEGLGLIEHREGHFRLTKRGWLLGNQVFLRIWGLAE